MSDSRIIEIRKSATIDTSIMRFPLLYVHKQFGYPVESILRRAGNMPKVHMGVYPDTFPNTIGEYYWVQKGVPGVSPWMALGVLTNGLYFYYTAFTNSKSTFIKNGHMNLWVSMRYSDLIHYGMDQLSYTTYINETSALENQ